jgi:hypothetical protein
MEINITKFYNEAFPKDYSASVMEIGNNAGKETWQAANDDSEDYMMLDNTDKLDAMREHIKLFGAWDDREICEMSDMGLNALLIQMISGDIRESCLNEDRNDWVGYQEESEAGQTSGRMFVGNLGEVYYYVGN